MRICIPATLLPRTQLEPSKSAVHDLAAGKRGHVMRRTILAAYPVALGLCCAAAGAQGANRSDGAPAQSAPCGSGVTLEGVTHDSTGATIAEAAVTLEDGTTTQTGKDGRFLLRCVTAGAHRLHVTATSFAPLDVPVSAARGRSELVLTLMPEAVEQTVSVNAGAARGVDNTETGVSRTIGRRRPESLSPTIRTTCCGSCSSFPQGAGGNPVRRVDYSGWLPGHQQACLPSRRSHTFASTPTLFAAEYQEPPYTGGRIEVYTKPGQPRIHGSLFLTYGGSALNASDPFTVSKGKIGKQRYGFDLSGPVRRQGSDFALSLEHRAINNVAAVNAVTLDSAGNAVPLLQTVPTPESLWEASARLAWQLGPRNTFTGTYTANQNQLSNRGAGGNSIAETAYDDTSYEHTLRFINITTASANLMHEARLSLHWTGGVDTPKSTAPQVQVAGAFTGGGNTFGAQSIREFGLEVADDAILTRGPHTLKVGINLRTYRIREQITQNFNGTYIFGGGTAPVLDANGNSTGSTATITGLEQYRRALLTLPGGSPTAYTGVTGTPTINYTQTRASIFAQDDWKLRPNLKLSFGARYYGQNDPQVLLSLVPRAGIAWSPDKAQKWTIKTHAGMFNGRYSVADWTELRRLDGVERTSSTIYSPVYGNPFLGATPIGTIRTLAPHFSNVTFGEEQFEVDRSLPRGWNVQGTFYWIRGWNFARSSNANSPLNGQPYGPRPGPANLNILQLQNSGSMKGDIEFLSVDQHTLKWLSIFIGYARVDLRDDTDNSEFFTPQSAFTDAGEYGRRTQQDQHQIFGNGTVHFPGKVDLSSNYYFGSGNTFNLTTGFDNNGDGDFNDRPTYARPGDPNAVATRYGLLVASGGTGVVPRNTGTMPFRIYLDPNLSRTFTLTPHAAKDSVQTLGVNLRAANVLNHTNVRQVGGVLGSPQFGKAYGADTGRRIEFGLRYSF